MLEDKEKDIIKTGESLMENFDKPNHTECLDGFE